MFTKKRNESEFNVTDSTSKNSEIHLVLSMYVSLSKSIIFKNLRTREEFLIFIFHDVLTDGGSDTTKSN